MSVQNRAIIEGIKAQIGQGLEEAFHGTIKEEMKKIHHEKINSMVYGVYSPSVYERRGDRGLLRDENFIVKVEKIAHEEMGVIGKYMNVTKPNQSIHFNATKRAHYDVLNENPYYLTALSYWIEYGLIYPFPFMKKRAYHSPRPFVAATTKTAKERLSGTNGVLEGVLQRVLYRATQLARK